MSVVDTYSDGHRRNRHEPACRIDGHGRRCLVDVYGTVIAHESGPDEWAYNVDGGEWSNLLDLAETILTADRERTAGKAGSGEPS